MATAIKAIPTLKGREAHAFLDRASRVEQSCIGRSARREHPYSKLAYVILNRAGMAK